MPPQRVHSLRSVFNALRYVVRAGCPWRLLPNDLPPWQIVHQQATRWLEAKVFENMVHDLRMILRLAVERPEQPSAAVVGRPHDAGQHRERAAIRLRRAQEEEGSQGPSAVDTLGHPLATHVSAANENERAHVEELLANVQAATGESVEVAYVDSGYNGEAVAAVATEQSVRLEVVSLPKAKKGFVLLPRRWSWNAPLLGWHAAAAWPVITNGFPPRWRCLALCSLLPCSCALDWLGDNPWKGI